ncbi:MAG: aminoacyl-tRNA hydrolase [Oscillospiraceae bacterium]|nr:aminoacyl-tRNA hydrolase [Oscillospiraceae bacterium]
MFFRKPAGISWLVVFLGNPGPKYCGTRHNAGFLTADAVEKRFGVSINRSRFKALTASCEINGEKVLFMKPQTYMNLSGEAVGQAAAFYHLPTDHVLVISDEMSLPVGKIRIRPKGSAGGHNGLKSIISSLGTDEFPRIRLGVGAPPLPDYDVKDWVLSVFRDQDAEAIAHAAEQAAEAIETYIKFGSEKAMNKYNGG